MEEKEMLEQDVSAVAEEVTAPAEQEKPAEGQEKKPMSKKKKILNGIFLGVQILLVVIAILLTIVMIMNPKQDDVSSASIKLLPVLTDSMDGERVIDGKTYKGFPAGALVIAKAPTNRDNLKVGDIVTFQMLDSKNNYVLNTHRIVRIDTSTGVKKYVTQGDNPKAGEDSTMKLPGDIKAVYVTHINGLGTALFWIRDGYHFIYVIIIPLGLLLIYNIFLVAQIIVEGKMKKARALAAENAKSEALASIDEEEIKRRAIEEYLRAQAAASSQDDEDPSSGAPGEGGDQG